MMKSEIVSTKYASPLSKHQQAIKDFIIKTQSDYFTKKLHIEFLLPEKLNIDHDSYDSQEFSTAYSTIQNIFDYCEANGIAFDQPIYYDQEDYTVVIYNEKKYKKEKEKKEQGHSWNIFDIFRKKDKPTSAPLFDRTSNSESKESSDKHPKTTDNRSFESNENNQFHSSSSTTEANVDTTPANSPFEQVNTASLKFDEKLSECIRIQINEIASRLVSFNKTAETAGFRSVCKINHIRIQPIDKEQDTIAQLSNFLTFYSGDKRKIVYLTQVMEKISPVTINYFNADEVVIEADLEVEKKVIDPFANLVSGQNTETNSKIIDKKWKVDLTVSYFDQDFNAMSDSFKQSKLTQADTLDLDMQIVIQDHLHEGRNANIITAPSYDFIIGRSEDADIQVYGDAGAGAPKFSRKHLHIHKNGNQWFVSSISSVPALIDGTDVITKGDSKVIKKSMSIRLGTSEGISTGEYGIYPEVIFNVASKSYAVEITDPSALNN